MACGYIFNKNGDLRESIDYIEKPEPVIGIAIDKNIPTHMLIFTNNHVYTVDRLIDQDKSTKNAIVFKLDVHIDSRYFESRRCDYPVTHPNDFVAYKYIGTHMLVFINKLYENTIGEKYFVFISDNYNKIIDGLYVRLSNIENRGKPIDDLEAFFVDKDVFIPIDASHLLDDSIALTMVHIYNDEVDSLMVYTDDGTFEKVEGPFDRDAGHNLLIEMKDLKLASKISEFKDSMEALKKAFDWYKSEKSDPYVVESHSIYMMNIIHSQDADYLFDKRGML